MNNFFKLSLFFLLSFLFPLCAGDITGFWKTINESNGKAESIVAIYDYDGKYYGRIIATYGDNGEIQDSIYAPKERAPGVRGDPYYSGMDIIWNLTPEGNKFTHGKILDPEHGRIYGAELWTNNGDLIVRGKILFFGRNQRWPKVEQNDLPAGFKLPDLNSLVPHIPTVK